MSRQESPETGWKAEIARRLEQGDGLEFSPSQFAQAVGASANDKALQAFLDEMVESAEA